MDVSQPPAACGGSLVPRDVWGDGRVVRRTGISVAAFLVIVAVFAVVVWRQNAHVGVSPQVGYTAPAFTLADLQGRAVSLRALRGRLVFLNFWASWCPPCRAETPDLERMYRLDRGKIDFYGVNLTADDSLPAARRFVKQFGVTYPVLLDKTGRVEKEYNILGIPASFFINRRGVIVSRIVGGMSRAAMRAQFAALLRSGP